MILQCHKEYIKILVHISFRPVYNMPFHKRKKKFKVVISNSYVNIIQLSMRAVKGSSKAASNLERNSILSKKAHYPTKRICSILHKYTKRRLVQYKIFAKVQRPEEKILPHEA